LLRGEADGSSGGGLLTTVKEALADYKADLQTRNGQVANVTRLKRHLPVGLLNKPVALLTVDDLLKWRNGLLEKGMKRATINRTITPLKAALTHAATTKHAHIKNREAWEIGLAKLPGAHRARNVVIIDPPSLIPTLVDYAYALDAAFGLM